MFGSLTPLVFIAAYWVVPAVVVAFLLYLVVRRGVRDGMLDARRVDAEEAAERRAREARAAGGPTADPAPTGTGPGTTPA